ncbi:MAG: hypothetical protein ACOC04_03730 [Halothece sp.]
MVTRNHQQYLSIYELIDGEYQVHQFRENEVIVSSTFPNLKLSANQIFQAGEIY